MTSQLVSAAEPQQMAFPSRRINLVVPFAAGGSTDLLARLFAEGLGRELGTAVVVENRPGAGTAVAAEFVARATPDGHTLLLATSSTLVFNPVVTPNLRYDPDRDFVGISLLAKAPMVLLIPTTNRSDSFSMWLRRVREQPDRFNFGSPGRGSSFHLIFEDFMATLGIRMTHIPYRGSQPALNALANGEIDAYIDLIPTAKVAVEAGLAKPLALIGAKRSSSMPALATLAEQGGPSTTFAPLFALVAPSGTPKAAVEQLHTAARRIMSSMDMIDRLQLLGFEVERGERETIIDRFSSDRHRWSRLIKERGITVDP